MNTLCTAEQLRKAFQAIPREQRDAHQPFAIRVWRGLSWLERAEQAAEVEDQFIALWIAFNALYGRQDVAARMWTERKAYSELLAIVWRLDGGGLLRSCLRSRQTAVLGIVGNKFLCREFWDSPQDNHDKRLSDHVRRLLAEFNGRNLLPILSELFDRLYLMRVQVFHGASTKGSKLNRRTLKQCTSLLAEIVPALITVMIESGIDVDWGEVCFPPVSS